MTCSSKYGDWHELVPKYRQITAENGLDNLNDFDAELFARVRRHGIPGDKGFIFGGHVGNGKTTRLRLMERRFYIEFRDARDLCVELTGLKPSDSRFKDLCNLQVYGHIEGDRWHCAHDLIIDDLGCESSERSSYGNRSDVMATVIDQRFQQWEKHGWRTFIATNYGVEDLVRAYGDRTYSRLCGMCEFIALPGGDRRMAR